MLITTCTGLQNDNETQLQGSIGDRGVGSGHFARRGGRPTAGGVCAASAAELSQLTTDAETRQLLGDLAEEERRHEVLSSQFDPAHQAEDEQQEEAKNAWQFLYASANCNNSAGIVGVAPCCVQT